MHFQPCFGQNSSSLDLNFSKFLFPRPPFFKENPLPRPYILKPALHTSTKKKLSAPRGVAPYLSSVGFVFSLSIYIVLLSLTVVCATDHVFVLYQWKLFGATVSLGTCLLQTLLALRARCLVHKQFKTESLTETTLTVTVKKTLIYVVKTD